MTQQAAKKLTNEEMNDILSSTVKNQFADKVLKKVLGDWHGTYSDKEIKKFIKAMIEFRQLKL